MKGLLQPYPRIKWMRPILFTKDQCLAFYLYINEFHNSNILIVELEGFEPSSYIVLNNNLLHAYLVFKNKQKGLTG